VTNRFAAEGVDCMPLRVSHAFHSPLVEPMLDAFERFAGTLPHNPAVFDLISNLTGRLIGAHSLNPRYWREHVRSAVQFAPAVRALAERGCTVCLEIGPHPTLIGMARQCPGTDAMLWLPSLRRGRGEWAQMLQSLAALYTAGVDIDWAAFDAPYQRRKLVLPTYPFQRRRYWIDAPAAPASLSSPTPLHPLLGCEVRQAVSDDRVFETQLGPTVQPWLEDHRILGGLLLPSPVHIEMALAAAAQSFGAGTLEIDDLTVHQALALDAGSPTSVQLVMAPPHQGRADFRVCAWEVEERRWQTCARGRVVHVTDRGEPPVDVRAIRARTSETMPVPAHYDWLASLGLDFGPRFRGIDRIHRCDGEVLARMQMPEALRAQAATHRLHPALLDACFQVVGAALPGGGTSLGEAFLPLQVERIRLFRALGESAWAHVTMNLDDQSRLGTPETFRADLQLLDDSGAVIAAFDGVHFKRARRAAMAAERLPARVREMLHEIVWRPLPAPDGALPSCRSIAAQVGPALTDLVARHGIDRYADFLPELDRLASAYIVQALQRLDFVFTPGEVIDPGALATRLGVLSAHRRLFDRMLGILSEDGLLAPAAPAGTSAAGWCVAAAPTLQDPDAVCDAVLARFPECDAELTLTRRCARELPAVLRGETNPLALLFPGGSLADTERLYRNSPPARTYNGLIAEVFGAIISATAGRKLRVLEIGAGTGSTTSHLLSRLPQHVEYTFTDVSPLFLNRAREKFHDQSFMRYELLDISRTPSTQGFAAGAFDVIVAANVLHATPDLVVTLGHVQELLAPGGLLVLLEATRPQRFGDLTVGLLDGWWAYNDTQRRSYALIAQPHWLALLAENGFEGAVAIPGDTEHSLLKQQAVFVAQRPAATTPRSHARWLIVPDDAGYAEALATMLRAAGDSTEMLPSEPDALAPVLRSALGHAQRWDGLLAMQALGLPLDDSCTTPSLWQGQERLVRSILHILHSLAAEARHAVPPVWLVTRGAQAALSQEAANPAQATLWGLSHVIAIEHPEMHCRRVDLDPASDPGTAASALIAELHSASREDQIAVRAGRRFARRLVHHPTGADGRSLEPTLIHPDRSYLVTGGLRGLGLRAAQWLVDQGARHLVLMGRSAPLPSAEAVIDALRSRNVTIVVAAGDVAAEADLQGVLDQVRGSLPPLAGVIHSAGALDDGVLAAQSWERFGTAMAAKVRGSWNLHRLAGELDFLVLFSSGASLAGSAGQANHAAANAFEDALAWFRQARRQPTVSINWGPWADIGAAADRKLSGPDFLQPIAPEDGLRALGFAMRRDPATGLFARSQLAVLRSDWSQLNADAETVSPLLGELVPLAGAVAPSCVSRSGEGSRARPEPMLRERLTATAPNRRRAFLSEYVRRLTAKVLGIDCPDELNVDEPLRQLGLDSLMAIELRNELMKGVGRILPATITFDRPSVGALVDYLVDDALADEFTSPVTSDEAALLSIQPVGESDELTADDLASRLAEKLDRVLSEESL
jgi:acyl transferase domain-containing protein/acyl carrier protein